MPEVTYSVMVRKTIQAKQYEPVTVELRTEGTCPEHLRNEYYDKAFKEIKAKMNEMFGDSKKKTVGCLG